MSYMSFRWWLNGPFRGEPASSETGEMVISLAQVAISLGGSGEGTDSLKVESTLE